MTPSLTLADLRALCDRYVPLKSRHPNSISQSDGWWHAHELGHLVVAAPDEIGQPMFGLDDEIGDLTGEHVDLDSVREHYLRCMELAAMSVSRRLLRACGRADLASDEAENTDYTTMHWDSEGLVWRILRDRGGCRIPVTAGGLERLLDHQMQRKLRLRRKLQHQPRRKQA